MFLRKYTAWLFVLIVLWMPGTHGEELELNAPSPAPTVAAGVSLSETPLLDTAPVSLHAPSVLLMEAESGQIIFEKNAEDQRPVASVTKVMTILLALESIENGRIAPQQKVTVSQNASGMGGSQVLLDTGEQQTLDVLLKSVIVGSANDAAVAIAECLYGSEELFVKKMNQRAEELGMENTVFVNCTGLPAAGQYTTARDVAIMTAAMLRHPMYFEYSGIWLDEVDHGDGRVTQLTNTNKLIRLYDGCDGGKTGSTNEAGYCLAATAKRGDMRLIAVVLGAGTSDNRFMDVKTAFDHGFANYRLYPVARAGTKIRGMLPVNGGDAQGVCLELAGELTLLLPKGEEQSIALVPSLPESVNAPVHSGQHIGMVNVLQNDKLLAEIPVIAAEDIAAKGLGGTLRRIWQGWGL